MPKVPRNKNGHILPGHALNPGGLPKEVAEIRRLTNLTKVKTIKTICEIASLPIDQLSIKMSDPKTPAIEVLVARLYSKAIAGSLPHANAILDRIIGPVPKNIQALDENGKPKDTQISMLQQIDSKALTQFVVNVQAQMKDITPSESISPNE